MLMERKKELELVICKLIDNIETELIRINQSICEFKVNIKEIDFSNYCRMNIDLNRALKELNSIN